MVGSAQGVEAVVMGVVIARFLREAVGSAQEVGQLQLIMRAMADSVEVEVTPLVVAMAGKV